MNQPQKMTLGSIQHSLIALAIAAAFPMSAMAQQAKTDDAAKPAESAEKKDAVQLETVIVTAQRRAENIKSVPMSISTLKGEKLDTLTASGADIRFLAARTPSLNVESDFGRSFPRFYIRGLGNTDFDLNASQPVGLVYDDVVQENPIIKGFPVFDVEQIEVLRGPQGTLFGRNSPAGVIKFESAKPTRKLEGYASIGYGSYDAVNLEGAINVPLTEDWAGRFSMQSQTRADRVFNNRPGAVTKSFEGYDDIAARLQLLYKPNKTFSALFNVHGRNMNGSATLFRANIIKKGTNELIDGFNYNNYPTDGGNAQNLETAGGSARLKWELDGITINSITGYEKGHFYSRGDVDGGFGAGPGSGPNGTIPFPAETADGVPDHHQFSQEVRVESNTKSPLQWLAGAYYFDEHVKIDSFDFSNATHQVDAYAYQVQDSKAWALFGSVNYAVTEQFKVRAGLRYTDDKKDFIAQRSNNFGSGALDAKTAHPSANNTSWDLSGTYELNKDTNLFGRLATGFRAPSIQGRVLFGTDISVANSEKNLSGEIGIKQDLFNRRARFSASLFQYRVRDLQLTAGSGALNQNRLVNVNKAEGQGFELDLQANLNENWKTTFSTSYNDTQIKDAGLFVQPCGNGCTVTNPAGPFPGTVSINGNPLPRAPKWVGNWSLRYSAPVGNGEFYALTDWSYRGTYNFFLYEAKEYKGKSLLEGGLRFGYKWDDGKYELAAYGRNITNKVQLVGAIDFNNLTGILNEPRNVGVQFKANF